MCLWCGPAKPIAVDEGGELRHCAITDRKSCVVHIGKFSSFDPPPEAAGPLAERITAGEPRAITRTFYESEDGRFSVGEWSCTPGRWKVLYDETEYCRIVSGHGTLVSSDGDRISFAAGEEFVVPAGFEGEWEVVLDMVKTWVVRLT